MADILHFVPQREKTAQENLAEFIRASREDSTVFGANLNWQANSWKPAGVSFGNLDQTVPKLDPAKTMNEPFLHFAKAYFVIDKGTNRRRQKMKCKL